MLQKEINLLEELDSISQIHFLKRNDIDTIMVEFATRILPALKIERINIWLFNAEKTALISMGEYDSRTKAFKKNSILEQYQFPVYFEALRKNEMIIAEDIYSNPYTMEFSELYSKPNQIYSLLDIPLRICGELIGVICFEKTETKKIFSVSEQTFCFSISFVLASALESRHRRTAQAKLEELLKEKEVLLTELNHRVRNNFSILVSLIRISKDNCKTQESKFILQEYEQRVYSMLKIHELLNLKHHHSNINLSEYVKEIVNEFRVSFPQFNHCINTNIKNYDYELSSKKALNLGLIITEILINSIKHAAQQTVDYILTFELIEVSKNHIQILISDNGAGFDFEVECKKQSLGLPLIKELAKSIDLEAKYPKLNQATYSFFIRFE